MSVVAARGFVAGGVACGIKGGEALDLAVVAAGRVVPAAGVFTTSTTAAPPVLVSRDHLTDGSARVVVLNSGCANAGTGARRLDGLQPVRAGAPRRERARRRDLRLPAGGQGTRAGGGVVGRHGL